MADIALIFDPVAFTFDIAIVNGQLVMDNTLRTAVIISLFTDRRANDDDVLPDYASPQMPGSGDKRGWWGDHYSPAQISAMIALGTDNSPSSTLALVPLDRWGSRDWLLSREKNLPDVLTRARTYAVEALQWLLDNNIASAVNVTVDVVQGAPGDAMTLRRKIEIVRPSRATENYTFDYVWNAQAPSLALVAAPNHTLDNFILDRDQLA